MKTIHSLTNLLALGTLPLAMLACKSTDIRRDEQPPVYRPSASNSPNQPLPPVAAPSAQRKPTLNQQPPVATAPPHTAPQYIPPPPVPAPVPQVRGADWDQVTSGQTSPNAPIATGAQAPPVDPNFRQVPVEGSDPTKQLRVKDERIGTGAEAGRKSVVLVHYTGWLYDSTKPDLKGERFDTTRKSSDPQANVPLGFFMGANRVVKGMEEGVVGMRVGGRRTVIIPPQLGYGEKGAGPIPPNATMIFDLELVRVQ